MLRELDGKLDLSRIHFLGALPYPDFLRLLQVSRAHAYLTYPFVLSWSMLEAMASGCTLLASATPPVTEVVRHGENGLLFDFFDHQALAAQAIDVLARPEAYAAVRAGRAEPPWSGMTRKPSPCPPRSPLSNGCWAADLQTTCTKRRRSKRRRG